MHTNDFSAAVSQAEALEAAGAVVEALNVYEALDASARNKDPRALHQLGLLAMRCGKFEQGLRALHQCLELEPSNGAHWLTLISALVHAGLIRRARDLLLTGRQRGLRGPQLDGLAGAIDAAWIDLPAALTGNQLLKTSERLVAQGKPTAAEFVLTELLQREPTFAHWLALGNLSFQLGKYSGALFAYQKALLLHPKHVQLLERLGDVLLVYMNMVKEARTAFAAAVSYDEKSVAALYGLGVCEKRLGNAKAAEITLSHAHALQPQNTRILAALADVQLGIGEVDRAIASYEKAIAIDPLDAAVRALQFVLDYQCLGTLQQRSDRAQAWGRQQVAAWGNVHLARSEFKRKPIINRKLRVGYISGDFYQHAVSVFFERILNYHDRNKIEIHAYSANYKVDDITRDLKAMVDAWHDVADMSDQQLVQHMREHELDVLVDLSGHTGFNRLPALAARVAPVQAHYLGYFATTGLPTIDYWIADDIVIPKADEPSYTEKIWRLPRCWLAYEGWEQYGLGQKQPEYQRNIWLGSFNALEKITPETIRIWSEILIQGPEFRLLIKTKALDHIENRVRIHEAFARLGVGPDRVRLIGHEPQMERHYAWYNEIDIALDPIGAVTGATTSCEALWMAVPIVTLLGAHMPQRMSASLLTALQHPEWIAQSELAYVQTVLSLGRDQEGRANLRAKQRERFKNSPLGNVAALAQSLETAYQQMFDAWWAECGAGPA